MHSLDQVMKAILVKIDTADHTRIYLDVEVTASDTFWMDVGYSLYLFKIGSDGRAWALLHQACNTAVTSDIISISGLRDILTKLSPVNTRIYPEVRRVLLQYLCQKSNVRSGPGHPTTILVRHIACHETENELFERAMSYLQGLLVARWGAFHPIGEKSHMASLRILRRDHQYEKAHRVATTLLGSMETYFGKYSIQTRRAARQFEHVLMDMQDYSGALTVCYGILGDVGWDGDNDTESVIIEDEISVYTMEDIAKSFEKTGHPDRCIFWLKRAAGLAGNHGVYPRIFLLAREHGIHSRTDVLVLQSSVGLFTETLWTEKHERPVKLLALAD
jgi:hypothetical protein